VAQLFPNIPSRRALGAGDHAELQVLRTLGEGLPDAYCLFHSVEWASEHNGRVHHGEVDILVVNRAGDILQLEVKAGDVELSGLGIFKYYQGKPKDVRSQLAHQYGAVRSRLESSGLRVSFNQLLVMPDQQVTSDTLTWPRSHIVDSTQMDQLCAMVQERLPVGAEDLTTLDRVKDFLGNFLSLEQDVGAVAQRLADQRVRIAAGLATWVPRIQAPTGVIRVVATAGSGKTQLALALLKQAHVEGKKSAYFCFNRSLSDLMQLWAPVTSQVADFHYMAHRLVKGAGAELDFSQVDVFEKMSRMAQEILEKSAPDLDVLIIDELQDFKAQWAQTLLGRCKSDSKIYLLEDPQQCLYPDRESIAIEGEVVVAAMENYRSPRRHVELCNLLRLTDTPVLAMSPFEGNVPEPITYVDTKHVERATVEAVKRCLDQGFQLGDIAVVSLRGRGSSQLCTQDQLGKWSTKRWLGTYDEASEPVWSQGELLIESVFRYKGQSSKAIVITEIDATDWSPRVQRTLFVALTRAQLHVEWVMSKAFESVLLTRASK
jgi:AAA domain